jgi:hypothetical protein
LAALFRVARCLGLSPSHLVDAPDVLAVMKPPVLEKKPKRMWADQGKGFYNAKFKALLKSVGAGIYSTYSDNKASIVERFIFSFLFSYLQPIANQKMKGRVHNL